MKADDMTCGTQVILGDDVQPNQKNAMGSMMAQMILHKLDNVSECATKTDGQIQLT